MTNGTPPRMPPRMPPPSLDGVRPSEQRIMPPRSGQRPPPAPPHLGGGGGGGGAGGGRGGDGGRSGGSAPRPAPQRRRRSVLSSALATIGVGLLVLVATGFGVLLLAPPTDAIRERAIAAVKANTGRDLVIRGRASLTFYPSFGVALRDIELSQPPGMTGTPFVTAESVEVGVKLLALLNRKVELERLVLKRPKFDLRIDARGRSSWTFAAPRSDSGDRVRFADASGRKTLIDGLPNPPLTLAQSSSGTSNGRDLRSGFDASGAERSLERLGAIEDIQLGDIRIVDGSVDFADERDGRRETLTSIDVQLAADRLNRPLTGKGDFDWNGETIRFDGTLTSLAEIVAAKPAKLSAKLSARPLEASYAGALDPTGATRVDGTVKAASPSLRALVLWLGRERLPGAEGLGATTFSGRLTATASKLTLDNADVSLDGVSATGRIAAVITGHRPSIDADLKVSALDLNPYLEAFTSATGDRAPKTDRAGPGDASPSRQRAATPTPPSEPAASPRSIEDLLRQPEGPRVKGYTKRDGWSDEAIDLAPLGLLDVNARLSLASLRVKDIAIGQSDIQLDLKDRVARVTFDRVGLYGGNGRGYITIEGNGDKPRINTSLVADGIAAGQFLADAADIRWLDGKGRVNVAVNGQGGSEREIVASLTGNAEVAMADGAITGINLARIIRAISDGKLGGIDAQPSEKTDFSQMSASFDIANGIATNKDLLLLSPLLRVTGEGKVMLPDRQIDYTMKPKVVANLEGQGGNSALSGIEIPVRITGDWKKPRIAPDLSKVDLNQASKAIEEIGRNLKGKNADQIVDELLGKDSNEARKAKKFLDKLFR